MYLNLLSMIVVGLGEGKVGSCPDTNVDPLFSSELTPKIFPLTLPTIRHA